MRLALHIGFFVLCSMASTAEVMAQPVRAEGIYTCIDAAGKRWTADRPIVQCADREQRVLGPTGVERRRLEPALSEAEMAKRLEQRRQEQMALQRAIEQRRRDAVLLARYPDRTMHDAARRDALAQVEALRTLAQQKLVAVDKEIQQLKQESDSSLNATNAMSVHLRDALNDLEQTQQEQKALVVVHGQEIKRIHQRFDRELIRLQPLWTEKSPHSTLPVSE